MSLNAEDNTQKSNDVQKSSSNDDFPKISMNGFLEFLNTSCQVNNAIVYTDTKLTSDEINYDKLSMNKMVNYLLGNLKSHSNDKQNDYDPHSAGDDINESNKRRNSQKNSLNLPKSIRSIISLNDIKDNNSKTNIHPAICSKLNEFIDEGIIDSVLPLVCPPSRNQLTNLSLSSTNSTTTNKQTKLKQNEIISSTICYNNNNNNNNINNNNNNNINNLNNNNLNNNNLNSNSSASINSNVSIGQKLNSSSVTIFNGTPRKNNGSNNGDKKLTSKSSDTSSINNVKIKDIKMSTTISRKSNQSITSSSQHSHTNNSTEKKDDPNVIIHVCDEVKNTSKDFICPQSVLVNKMGYFADVTAGQKLEDMDISVHCDIQIFEWLMKWIKRSQNQIDTCPQLDAINVIPILVSASFLQMEPLLLDCLSFCHSRLTEVVRSSTNLSCLNDSIITRLSAMFTNLELEMVKDKKERVVPRLWTKLIQSLCEPEPQALRGHYYSLAGIFRCLKCGKYLTQTVCIFVSCIPANTRLNRWGQVVSEHIRDTNWELTNYVASLFKELKSWRKVYWKLWGHCHYLYCCICETHFPAHQMAFCQYHPENPQYLGPSSEGLIAGPAGRYACCGQQAFRYETLPGPNGCQFREHSVLVETDRDRAIVTLAQIAADGGCLFDPANTKSQTNGQIAYEPKWIGMSLIPIKCRQGLLPSQYMDELNLKTSRRMRKGVPFVVESSSGESDSSENVHFRRKNFSHPNVSTSSDCYESETNSPTMIVRRGKGHKQSNHRSSNTCGRYWSGEASARSNQDNQREYEEKIMKSVMTYVNKKISTDMRIQNSTQLNPGSYFRLEAEWKEQFKQKNSIKNKLK